MKAIDLADRSTGLAAISHEEARARASQARSEFLHACFVSLGGAVRRIIDKAAGAGAGAPLPGLDTPETPDGRGPASGLRA